MLVDPYGVLTHLVQIFTEVYYTLNREGRDNSVGIATRYGLDGPGFDSRWGWVFPHPSRPTLVTIQPPIQWISGLFPRGKEAGAWRWPPTPSSAEIKERVELYLDTTSEPSLPVLGWTLHLRYRGADKSLARPGRKQAQKHDRDARDFNNMEPRAVIRVFYSCKAMCRRKFTPFWQTLACFLPGRAKDLLAPMYNLIRRTHKNTDELFRSSGIRRCVNRLSGSEDSVKCGAVPTVDDENKYLPSKSLDPIG